MQHRVGVISDTHIPAFPALPEAIWQHFAGVELIIHAGDLPVCSIQYVETIAARSYYLSSGKWCTIQVIFWQAIECEIEKFSLYNWIMAGYQVALLIAPDNAVHCLVSDVDRIGKYWAYGISMLENIPTGTGAPFIKLVHNSWNVLMYELAPRFTSLFWFVNHFPLSVVQSPLFLFFLHGLHPYVMTLTYL